MFVTVDRFVELHPKLYHMAEEGAWESIVRHGLMSTKALLDLYEVDGAAREKILEHHRPECVTISHGVYGTAVVRDQKPMSDSGLSKALQDGLTPRDWYMVLNGKTFFWTTKERLLRLLQANAYRDKRHTVLTVDSAEMFARHGNNVTLSPYNSGATKPNPFPRGKDCFLPIYEFPYEYWREEKGRGMNNVFVELVVEYGVPDIAEFTDRVELMQGSNVLDVIFP